MFKNYIKAAFRSVLNQKLYSLINVIGLTTGITVCMLIVLYMNHEMSFDTFHKDNESIYSLQGSLQVSENKVNTAKTSYAAAMFLKDNVPDIKSFVRIFHPKDEVVIKDATKPTNKFSEREMIFVDRSFLNLFSFRISNGDSDKLLQDPFTLIVTDLAAIKYFGDVDVIGKVLQIKVDSAFYLYTINGIIKAPPSNSSIQFSFISSNETLNALPNYANLFSSQTIDVGEFETYIKTEDNVNLSSLQVSINNIVSKSRQDSSLVLSLLALPDVHLQSKTLDKPINKYFTVYPIIAGLILLLAIVNYMSLSTASFTKRGKEIAVRKVVGAHSGEIVKQFYIECFTITTPAFVLAYIFCFLTVPLFSSKFDIKIDTSYLYQGSSLLIGIGIWILTTILAGFYPSLVLSVYQPSECLKGLQNPQQGAEVVRKTFTVLQFSISIVLLTSALIMGNQIRFMHSSNPGLETDNIIMVPFTQTVGAHYSSFKSEINSLVGVSGVATAFRPMYKGYDMSFLNGRDGNVGVIKFTVDKKFISLLNIKWKIPPVNDFNYFSENKVVLNESALNKLGLSKKDAIGSFIAKGRQSLEIAGVINNFNFSANEKEFKPMAILFASDTSSDWSNSGGCLYLKVGEGSEQLPLLNSLKTIYDKYETDEPFKYTFMAQEYERQYLSETNLYWIFKIFSICTLFLAIIGLFGLSAFTIGNRKKEVAIRKILGADISNIIIILSKEFFKLILISICLGSIPVWWIMSKWLQNFFVRIDISLWMFLFADLVIFTVAILTISYHTVKLAVINPINSIKSE